MGDHGMLDASCGQIETSVPYEAGCYLAAPSQCVAGRATSAPRGGADDAGVDGTTGISLPIPSCPSTPDGEAGSFTPLGWQPNDAMPSINRPALDTVILLLPLLLDEHPSRRPVLENFA